MLESKEDIVWTPITQVAIDAHLLTLSPHAETVPSLQPRSDHISSPGNPDASKPQVLLLHWPLSPIGLLMRETRKEPASTFDD